MIHQELHRRCAVVLVVGLISTAVARAHEAHMLIGRSTSNQLKWHPSDGVPGEALTVLTLIPPGGPIQGYSASVPGFSLVLTASAEDDCYPLQAGADVWLELIAVAPVLLMIETPSYRIINDQIPPLMRIGGQVNSHVHPLWLLDSTDPAFSFSQCVWEARFILDDRGTTGYADSDPITFRFSAGRVPCPADFDCDSDVDADDLATFAACATGPAVPYASENPPEGCTLAPDDAGIIGADFDRDDDVDQLDFAWFQRCYSGQDVPADPDCGS